MGPDRNAFIVVSCEATMTVLWRAMREIRSALQVARVHWHPDERYSDGLHFRVEVPISRVANPVAAQEDVRSILIAQGASLTF
jgi:hypothetical protein